MLGNLFVGVFDSSFFSGTGSLHGFESPKENRFLNKSSLYIGFMGLLSPNTRFQSKRTKVMKRWGQGILESLHSPQKL
jgi:hypothetical protein